MMMLAPRINCIPSAPRTAMPSGLSQGRRTIIHPSRPSIAVAAMAPSRWLKWIATREGLSNTPPS